MSEPIAAVLSAAEVDARYQPTRTRTTICMDSDLVLQIARLEQQMAAAANDQTAASQELTLAQEIVDLREQAKASEVEFVFRSIGRHVLRGLIREHPPTKAQEDEAGQKLQFNPDTFMPALFAAACEAPTGTDVAWWTRKCEQWGEGQVTRLWNTCNEAQAGVQSVPKAARAYALIRPPEPNSE